MAGLCLMLGAAWTAPAAAKSRVHRQAGDDDTITVRVKGRSAVNEEAAKKDARRNAIESAGNVHIVSQSEVEDFALKKDIIKTRADGLIVAEKFGPARMDGDGVWEVELEAKVSKSKLDATWAEVAIVLEQLGHPVIMLFFEDWIQVTQLVPGERAREGEMAQRRLSDPSIVGNQITRMLTDYGFEVKNAQRAAALNERDKEEAGMKGDVELLQAYARRNGADLFLEGTAKASGPVTSRSIGDGYPTVYQWKTFGQCHAYWADSGMEFMAMPALEAESASKYSGDDGAKRALDKTGVEIGREIVFELLDKMTRRALDGSMFTLRIGNVKGRRYKDIREAIARIENVESVTQDSFDGSTLFLRVKTRLQSSDLMDAMYDLDFVGFSLELDGETSRNEMRWKVVDG